MSCVGCEVDIKLVGSGSGESALLLVGEVKAQTVGLSADLVEVLGSQTAWTGAVTIEADEMVVGSRASVTVSAGASVLPGAAMRLELGRLEVQRGSRVVCSGSGCMSVVVSARDGALIEGTLECTPLMCRITAEVLNATVTGTVRGGDVNLTSSCSLNLSGSVSVDGLGYGSHSGDGPGTSPTPGAYFSTSYDSMYYGSGGGGGHGGMGANSCFKSTDTGYVSPQVYGAGQAYGNASAPRSFGSGGGRGLYYYVLT